MKKSILDATLPLMSTVSAAGASFQLIRSSTVVLNYNGRKILVDPMLSEKGALQSFAGIARNPTVDLTVPVAGIISAVDVVLVTHSHADHFDQAASDLLDKSVTLFHQPSDTAYFEKEQFVNARPIEGTTTWKGIEIIRVEAQHGSGDILKYTGKASGFILKADDQPTIYIVGDSILTPDVINNIQLHSPDYIIVNAGGASLPSLNSGPIIMDDTQTVALIKESGHAKIIAIHMEALDHCSTTRSSLRAKADEANIEPGKLIIPADGEVIRL
jgi:L-ascorbate metabolism protein UlaG (beta-lactamase superfamily)